jgi:hypothetical protein
MRHDGSAYLSTKRQIEEAEDRGFDEGRDLGRTEMREAIIDLLERSGNTIGAQLVREAKIVERTE